jgi:hypothetical protein
LVSVSQFGDRAIDWVWFAVRDGEDSNMLSKALEMK